MPRLAVAVLTALLAAGAAPAAAHRGHLPPMPPLPREPVDRDYDYGSHREEFEEEEWRDECRAEYLRDSHERDEFAECEPYPGPHAKGYHYGPADYGYGYGYGYGFPVVMVPVKIKTRYIYSEPLRREREVVVEEWVEEAEPKAGRRSRKTFKAAPGPAGKTIPSK